MRQHAFTSWFRALAFVVLLFGAWAGCRCRPAPPEASNGPKPSLKLVLVSGVAGAIEPCGCVKDMLGGVDHAAAYVKLRANERSLVLGAGPMLFMDPTLAAEKRAQDQWKAEALMQGLAQMGLRAWAPGANDFAAGTTELGRLAKAGPAPLALNLSAPDAGLRGTAIYNVGGIRVGVAGLSHPRHAGRVPEGLAVKTDFAAALRASAAELTKQGANVRVALVALPRGEALRLAELVPDFEVMLVGKPVDEGEGNDPITPPVAIGRTLVVESPNHLQAFHVVDLYVKNGSFEFENAEASSEARADLDRRILELERRIRDAKNNPSVSKADLSAREKDLETLKKERKDARESQPAPKGSHYRVSLVEVRESLGSDPAVQAKLAEYYRRVNDHNKEAFRDRRPKPVPEGGSGFLGAQVCVACHQEEHAFWSKTRHAKAYETLSVQHKEFNLDCVGCHVTGYDQPGGSTVVHVDGLKDVQCEVCHGPGSRHIQNPTEKSWIIGKPDRNLCGPTCHHVPHVKPDWSVDEAWKHIIGPGHGR